MPFENHPYGSRDLKIGDTGTDVQDLQVKIVAFASVHSHLVCDGHFLASTQDALVNFCKLQGLKSQKSADSKIFEAIEAWIDSEAEFVNIFQSAYPCHCSTENQSYKRRAGVLWDLHVRGKVKNKNGEVVSDSICTGYGSELENTYQFAKGSNFEGRNNYPPEPQGFNKLLLWAVLGARKILQHELGVKSLGLHINSGYRCQVNYFQVMAQREEFAKAAMAKNKKMTLEKYLTKYQVAVGNHLGNAVDVKFKIKGCEPGPARDLLQKRFGFLETFDKKEKKPNILRLEPRHNAPTWTHIDTTNYEYQVYVKTVQDALEPRYTPGKSNLPVRVNPSALVPTAPLASKTTAPSRSQTLQDGTDAAQAIRDANFPAPTGGGPTTERPREGDPPFPQVDDLSDDETDDNDATSTKDDFGGELVSIEYE